MNRVILVVDDDENDLLFAKMAMDKAGVRNPVQAAKDGQEALDYLQGTEKFADRLKYPLPYMVLLDLKLPYVMGLDVLTWIRSQPQFKTTIVIVLTSSRHIGDIRTAYQTRRERLPGQAGEFERAGRHDEIAQGFLADPEHSRSRWQIGGQTRPALARP